MSDTPPSIPPRKRPTTPVTAGGTRPAASGGARSAQQEKGEGGARPAAGKKAAGAASGRATGTAAERSAGTATTASGTAPGAAPERASTKAAPAAKAGPTASEKAPRKPAEEVPTPHEAPVTQADGQVDGQAGAGADQPSPLVTAVDATTVWFKKAAGATGSGLSRAYAQLTRPRTEDADMTTTPSKAGPSTAERPAPRSTAPVTGATARPATGRVPSVGGGGPRRVRLAVSRVDPWSVMKLAFLLSVAVGIMIVVAAVVVWFTLDGLHVFATIDDLVKQVVGSGTDLSIMDYVSFEKTVSAATLVAVIDVFLLTALATIGAFLYNIVAALVGGVHVTMTDE
jgi:hypothetical protein